MVTQQNLQRIGDMQDLVGKVQDLPADLCVQMRRLEALSEVDGDCRILCPGGLQVRGHGSLPVSVERIKPMHPVLTSGKVLLCDPPPKRCFLLSSGNSQTISLVCSLAINSDSRSCFAFNLALISATLETFPMSSSCACTSARTWVSALICRRLPPNDHLSTLI